VEQIKLGKKWGKEKNNKNKNWASNGSFGPLWAILYTENL